MAKKSFIEQELETHAAFNAAVTQANSASPQAQATSASQTTQSSQTAAPPATPTLPDHVPGEVIVKFAAGLSAAGRAQGLSQAASVIGGQAAEVLDGLSSVDPSAPMVARFALGKGIGLDQAIQMLSKLPSVEVAEPNWIYTTQTTSNDSYYTGGSLWGMYGDTTGLGGSTNQFGSQANEAWAAGKTGATKTVVGIIDTGIDYTHPDLYLNVWLNQSEIKTLSFFSQLKDVDTDGLITFRDLNDTANKNNANLSGQYLKDWNANGRIDAGDLLNNSSGWENKIDDDKNGRIDDLIGWDFVNNDNDPLDDNNHGSHVSGTIGGLGGNSAGVVGVNWNVQLMALKFLSSTGSGSTTGAINAVNYYTAEAAAASSAEHYVATNNSWGGGGFSQTLLDAIANGAKKDVLFVAAAGNGDSAGNGINNDATPSYPANYNTTSAAGYDAVISVAAIDSSGRLASFSNYGATSVDLGAPGVGIWSTVKGGGYSSFSGTSMATPHVTGALALLASADASLSAAQLKAQLLSAAADTSSLFGKTATDGRLDVGTLMSTTTTPPPPPPPPSAGVTLWGTSGNDTITGTSGADQLAGIPSPATSLTSLGRGSIDQLIGLGGADVFLLGDSRGRFYDDGSTKTSGTGDYGYIADFSQAEGDKIQLASGSYFLVNVNYGNGISGTGIFHDSNGNGRYASNDELIGIVGGVTASALLQSDLVFV